jgi:hypothetical protein
MPKPKREMPKKFLAFNSKLQREIKTQRKEHPKLPQKFLVMISADHVKLDIKGKKQNG